MKIMNFNNLLKSNKINGILNHNRHNNLWWGEHIEVKNIIKTMLKQTWVYKKVYQRIQYELKLPQLTIELTNCCNLACTYCPHQEPSFKRNCGHMDYTLFKNIIDKVKSERLKLRGITLTGLGEPLLYPQIYDAIKYCKSKLPEMPVQITTNGTLLDILSGEKLIASRLDKIGISINSPSKEKYMELNGSDMYDRVVKHTMDFMELKERTWSNIEIVLKVLGTPANTKEGISEFQAQWSGDPCTVVIEPLLDWAGLVDSKYTKQLNHDNSKRYPCYAIGKEWVISKNGICYPCCMSLATLNLSLCDIARNTLKNAFIEDAHAKMYKRMNLESGIRGCVNCYAYLNHPNVWQALDK